MKTNKFYIGAKVHWNDPAIEEYPEDDRTDILNRVFTIFKINGEVISICDEYSEVEVLKSELSLVE